MKLDSIALLLKKRKLGQKVDIGKTALDALKKEIPFALGAPAIVWQVFFFYIPIFLMISTSLFDPTEKSLTQTHFIPLFKGAYFTIIKNSLWMASSTSIICLAIGFPLAYFLAFKVERFRTILLFLLIVPFWTNFLLHIYAWFFVLEREGFMNQLLLGIGLIKEPLHLLNSLPATMVMMVYYYLPFMVLPIYFSLERFNKSFIDASLDLGATSIQTFRRILLPLTLRAISGGFFLVFIPSFGEFIIPELMGGDRTYYVGNVISQFIFGEETASIGVAFTVMSISCLALSIGIILLSFRATHHLLIRGSR